MDTILKTANLPFLINVLGLAYNGDTPFQAEVYFINMARIIQIPFAVPYFDLYDPRYHDFGVPTAVRGKLTFSISNYKKFVKFHWLIDFDLDDFQKQIKEAVSRYAKNVVANIPAEKNVDCHNYFGMKWKAGCGCDYKEYQTKEQRPDGTYYTIMAKFRKYKDPADGIKGYYDFLSGYKRYHNLIGVTDAGRACDLIRQDGWATSLKYSENLKKLIIKHQLQSYDAKVLGGYDLEAVARDVIDGKYGNGEERKALLKKMGYDPAAVQKIVNRILR